MLISARAATSQTAVRKRVIREVLSLFPGSGLEHYHCTHLVRNEPLLIQATTFPDANPSEISGEANAAVTMPNDQLPIGALHPAKKGAVNIIPRLIQANEYK